MALTEELRLLSIRVLQNFVRETGGDWSWEQWQRLIQRVRRMGFATITEGHIRELAERNRQRWLTGDNSVEPAPVPLEAPSEAEAAPSGSGVSAGPEPREETEPAAYSGLRWVERPVEREERAVPAVLKLVGESSGQRNGPDRRAEPGPRARPAGKAKKVGKKSKKKAKKKVGKKVKKKAGKKKAKKKAKKKPK